MEKYGFVYLWYDRKHKRFYIGSHWGTEEDGYVCSSKWMKQAYRLRPMDFKRRILKRVYSTRKELLETEANFISRIKPEEIKKKYYNLCTGSTLHWSATPNAKSIAKKSGDARKGKSLGPCSAEKAKKISEAKKGKSFSDQHKEALKVSRAKQVFSEESNKKRSESLKKAYAEGRRATAHKGKPKPVRLCLECCAATPSRRALYCLEHRYTAMNKTTANLADSKWANSKA